MRRPGVTIDPIPGAASSREVLEREAEALQAQLNSVREKLNQLDPADAKKQ